MSDEKEIPVLEDWDYGEFRALDPNANLVARLFGYKCLHGTLDGENVESAPFVKWDGEYAWVGLSAPTRIKLGQPKKEYVEWCRKLGVHIPTREKPFKELTSDEEFQRRKIEIAARRIEMGM